MLNMFYLYISKELILTLIKHMEIYQKKECTVL